MAPRRALYYPWTAVRDPGWKRSVLLYWDEIHTIAPGRHVFWVDPASDDALLLDEEVLRLQPVEPDTPAVTTAGRRAIEVLESGGFDRMMTDPDQPSSILFDAKLDTRLKGLLTEKLGEGQVEEPDPDGIGPLGPTVPDAFIHFYVGLLADELATEQHLAVVTDSAQHHSWQTGRVGTEDVAGPSGQHLLVEVCLNALQVRPDVEVRDVLNFRDDHADALNRFHAAVGELSAEIPDELTPVGQTRAAEDVYKTKVEPMLQDLEEGLQERRMGGLGNGLLQAAGVTMGLTNMGAPPSVLTLGPLAWLSVSALQMEYRIRQLKRENPGTYLFKAKRDLGTSSP